MVVCCWLYVGSLSLFVVRCLSSDVCCLLSVVRCRWSLFVVRCLSCDVCFGLFVVDCGLS